MEVPLPRRFEMPTFERYEGLSDPIDHLDTFRVLMQLQGAPDAIMCRAFAATLKGSARDWYRTLRLRSIGSFLEMEQLFTNHFLRRKNPPVDMGELIARAQKYINLEEIMDNRGTRIELKRKGNNQEMSESSKSAKRHENALLTSPNMRRLSSKFSTYTPLNTPRSEDHGHDTEECIHLRSEIEALIKRGYLLRFIKKEDPPREPREQKRPNTNDKEEQIIGEIAVIFGEAASGGDNGGTCKSIRRDENGKGKTQTYHNPLGWVWWRCGSSRRDNHTTCDHGDDPIASYFIDGVLGG
ncbi:uncharacterized protein LOC131147664 [Malania oleifera]|uniref:uncharacterized protein LOC131147664 n=1 Tax=Malania oleifera TaxID=397392 RepID=UPI0025AE5444|nr:uncharacterized protein LOC131147664 [Malania oleifera]